MKKIVTAALAASFMISAAAPAFAQEASCSSLPGSSGINPTELSERQQCLMDTVYADKQSGIIGNHAFVRIGGEIYTVPAHELRKHGAQGIGAVHAYFQQAIEHQLDKEVQLSLEVLDDAQELFSDLRETGLSIEQAKLVVAASFKGIVFVDRVVTETVTETVIQYQEKIVTVERIVNVYNTNTGEILAAARQTGTNNYVGATTQDALDSAMDRHGTSTYAETVGAVLVQGAGVYNTEIAGTSYDVTAPGVSLSAGYSDLMYAVGLVRVKITVDNSFVQKDFVWGGTSATAAISAVADVVATWAFEAGLQTGFLVGYASGYEDGYEAGYKDGYADGYTDGVASVQ